MNVDLVDAVGLAGSTLFIAAFLYANRAAVLDKRWFNALNLVGAILLLWSLWHRFNLAAFVLEVVWAGIALAGLIAALRRPKPLPSRGGVGVGPVTNGASNNDSPHPPTPSPQGEGEL